MAIAVIFSLIISIPVSATIIYVPADFALQQNYPNPFNISTTIRYTLPEPLHITIDIYDILGRKAATLIDKPQFAGYHQVVWNAEVFTSGVYLYKITAGDFTESRKMILTK